MDTAITFNLSDEQKEALINAAQVIADVLNKIWERIKEVVTPIFEAFSKFLNRTFKRSASPKIYHLAYHAKKARVRKKNKARIFDAIRRIVGGDD